MEKPTRNLYWISIIANGTRARAQLFVNFFRLELNGKTRKQEHKKMHVIEITSINLFIVNSNNLML